jgi:hypothetical protein
VLHFCAVQVRLEPGLTSGDHRCFMRIHLIWLYAIKLMYCSTNCTKSISIFL